MKPSEKIKAQVRTVMKSQIFHILIVEGRPGSGKTTAVSKALHELGIKPKILGSYSTPLGFFNFMHDHSDSLLLIDDTSNVFSSSFAMALLKSATWDQPGYGRLVRWTSTSEKAVAEEFVFRGKLIIICNSFPRTIDAQAVRNRGFEIQIEPGLQETRELLSFAAKDIEKFQNQKIAQKILKRLLDGLSEETLSKISYRTLQRDYEIAVHNPESWETMADSEVRSDFVQPKSVRKLIVKLSETDLKVKDQLKEFERRTGFKRRTFFKYRKELELQNE